MDISKAKQQVKDTVEAYLATNEYGMPMLDVARQRPIFLVGAPGIGKTAIMAQIADELGIGLVSYSMTHHTRQSALGLPFIVNETYGELSYEASEYTMSEIVASIYSYMRETGIEQGILFLDEINCVSETLYPSMLQFLQFKTFGRHKIPDGWIVVTAGNPPEYNRSVHEFDIVTLDRLKRISVEPSFDAWKSYASARHTHPAVLSFLGIKKDRFYSVETTLDGKSFVTARGWDDLSEIMLVFEALGKSIDYDLIVQYVQNEKIAREFDSYYALFSKYRDDYRIDDILRGCVSEDVMERACSAQFDERLSLIGLLLDSVCNEMSAVMDETRLILAIRDELRWMKECTDPSDAPITLGVRASVRRANMEMQIAAGSLVRSKREAEEQILAALEALAATGSAGSAKGENAFILMKEAYDGMVSGVEARAAMIEQKLAFAFSFIEEAFGDAQELLVFVTELTSRTGSAAYIAQFGSACYFDHNERMILSERQRDLRARVERLDL